MPSVLFYVFSVLMLACGVTMVLLKNPVSSAFSMIGSFIGLAALLIGLNAYFIGILQVLVYAGAVMVLFLFIIMLLDLKAEVKRKRSVPAIAAAVIIPLLIVLQLSTVLGTHENGKTAMPPLNEETLTIAESILPTDEVPANSKIRDDLKKGQLPDVNLIGQKLFTDYHFPLQMVGILLVVATVGCVALSKKFSPSK